jgi:chromosomal replication initiator protein
MTGVLPKSKMVSPNGKAAYEQAARSFQKGLEYLAATNRQLDGLIDSYKFSEIAAPETEIRRIVREELAIIQAESRLPADRYEATVALCIDLTALVFCVEREAIIAQDRRSEICRIRHAAMWLARRVTSQSLSEIGQRFKRDHSSIIHGVAEIERRWGSDPEFDEKMVRLSSYFKAVI